MSINKIALPNGTTHNLVPGAGDITVKSKLYFEAVSEDNVTYKKLVAEYVPPDPEDIDTAGTLTVYDLDGNTMFTMDMNGNRFNLLRVVNTLIAGTLRANNLTANRILVSDANKNIVSSSLSVSDLITTSNIGSQHVSRSDEANSLQGYAPAVGSSANTVVVRDSGGYIWSEYYNCTNRSIQSMQDFTSNFAFFSSDGFLRKATIESARTALNNVSSSRLVKENIVDMPEDEAKKILDLHVVDFDYINGKKNQRGLIAEETLNVAPYCVDIPKDYDEEKAKQQIANGEHPIVPGIDYSKLVAPLIKLVQIQQRQIEKLKAEVERLKDVIES